MTKFGTLGAAAIAACMLAAPAMAQQVMPNSSRCAQLDPNADCRNLGPGHSSATYQRVSYRHADRIRTGRTDRDFGWNDDRRHDEGFWPAEAAAGVVGAAVGTGLAVATAPLRADAYAWDNDYRGGWSESYAKRNGFVCRPEPCSAAKTAGSTSASSSQEPVETTKAAREAAFVMATAALPNRSNRLVAVRRQL